MLRQLTIATTLIAAITTIASAQPCDLGWEYPFGPFSSPPDDEAKCAKFLDLDGAAGTPPVLVVGGYFTTVNSVPVNALARWDGQTWSGFGSGFLCDPPQPAFIMDITLLDHDQDPDTPEHLVAGGVFEYAGGIPTYGIASWNGTAWEAYGSGLSSGGFYLCRTLITFDFDGSGPALPTLVAGGFFSSIDDVPVVNIAHYDGTSWSNLGEGLREDWSGGNSNCVVSALHVHDVDGPGGALPYLYAGGTFELTGEQPVGHIARWDGDGWVDVGGGIPNSNEAFTGIFCMTTFDPDGDGPMGPQLYVGGHFHEIGGVAAENVARWDGENWWPVGEGLGDYYRVDSLTAFDEDGPGGSPPMLYAGTWGLVPDDPNCVARWNGEDWVTLGEALDDGGSGVTGLATRADDCESGVPCGLYAVGDFTEFEGREIAYIVRRTYCPVHPGDVNCDGLIDFDDIQPLIKALQGRELYEAAFPNCNWFNADCDLDGHVTFDDIAPFVQLIN